VSLPSQKKFTPPRLPTLRSVSRPSPSRAGESLLAFATYCF